MQNTVSLYPESKPYETGYFDTGEGHELYYERYGNPAGEPVVYLHGGPGGGCRYNEYRFFDTAHYNVLLYDQRGAPRSKPFAGVEDNNIPALVADLEKMRERFGFDSWNVAGGSFGSTLGMFYAALHPACVKRLLLRGIFFGDGESSRNLIDATGLLERSRNEWFTDYLNHIPAAERGDGLALPYYRRLMSDDVSVVSEAARLFMRFDASIATKDPNLEMLEQINKDPHASIPISRLFFHFSVNEFMKNDYKAYLLREIANLKMPIDIIHGRQDWICPVESAIELHERCPSTHLTIVENAGHSMAEPGLQRAFIAITDRWKQFKF